MFHIPGACSVQSLRALIWSPVHRHPWSAFNSFSSVFLHPVCVTGGGNPWAVFKPQFSHWGRYGSCAMRHSRSPYQDHGRVDQWEATSVTGTLSRVIAYTYVQVTSGLAVMGLGVSQPKAPSSSLSPMARRSLQLGVGAHGWVVLFCWSWGHYFNLGAGCQ